MEKLKDEDFLITNLGFVRVDNDDFSGHWLTKDIAHPFLTNCQVMIDTIVDIQLIFVQCKDWDATNAECTICQQEYSKENLAYLLKWLMS